MHYCYKILFGVLVSSLLSCREGSSFSGSSAKSAEVKKVDAAPVKVEKKPEAPIPTPEPEKSPEPTPEPTPCTSSVIFQGQMTIGAKWMTVDIQAQPGANGTFDLNAQRLGGLKLAQGNVVSAAYVSGGISWHDWSQWGNLNDLIYFSQVDLNNTFVNNYTLGQMADGVVVPKDKNGFIVGVKDDYWMYYDNNGSAVISYRVLDRKCP